MASPPAVGVLVGRPAAAATIIFDTCTAASLCRILQVETALDMSGSINAAVTAPPGYGIFGDAGANRACGFNVDTGAGSDLPLLFTVSRTGGFTSDLDLIKANSLGYLFAAHLRDENDGGHVHASAGHGPRHTGRAPPAQAVMK